MILKWLGSKPGHLGLLKMKQNRPPGRSTYPALGLMGFDPRPTPVFSRTLRIGPMVPRGGPLVPEPFRWSLLRPTAS